MAKINLYQVQHTNPDNEIDISYLTRENETQVRSAGNAFGWEITAINLVGEILFDKYCPDCGNRLLVLGIVNEFESTKTAEVTVDIPNYNNRCHFKADTLVQCECGRKMRMVSRRKWLNDALQAESKAEKNTYYERVTG